MSKWMEPLERRALLSAAVGSVEAEWPTFGGNPQHTGAVTGSTAGLLLTPIWSKDSTVSRGVPVATGDGKVFVSDAPDGTLFGGPFRLRALDSDTGQVLWTATFDNGTTLSAPTYYDGRVYVQWAYHSSSATPKLYALDADTGGTLWTAPFTAQWETYAAPAADSTGVWINGGYYGGMYGFRHDGTQITFKELYQVDKWSPSLKDGFVYAYAGPTLTKYNATTGLPAWSYDVNPTAGYYSPGGYGRLSVLDGNTAYLPVGDAVQAVDLTTGLRKWETEWENSEGTPAVKDGVVYVNTGEGVKAYSTATGAYLRTYTINGGYSGNYYRVGAQPIVTADALIAATEDSTTVFDLATGQVRQTLPVGGQVALGGGYLYISSQYGGLYAYQFGGGLSGTVFNDANANGLKETGEAGYTYPGLQVYLDLDQNNLYTPGEPTQTPDADGRYAFRSLQENVFYGVGLKLPPGLQGTTPGKQYAYVAAGQTVALNPIGVTDIHLVKGTVFKDADADGVRDSGELGIPNRVVFADLNQNGLLDTGETSAVTDANGQYTLGLDPGYYVIAQVLPGGNTETGRSSVSNGTVDTTGPFARYGIVYVQTYSTPPTRYDFGAAATGQVGFSAFDDLNANGVLDAGEAYNTSANTVWADKDNDGVLDAGEPSMTAPSGTFTLPVGTYTMRILPKSATQTAAPIPVTVTAGGRLSARFALVNAPYRVYGYAYHDTDADGVYDSGEPTQVNRTVYVDANNNSALDPGEVSTTTASTGYFVFELPAGTYRIRQVLPAGYRATGQNLGTATSGSTFGTDNLVRVPTDAGGAKYLYFGSRPLATVSGSVWLDSDADGVVDATESATAAGGFVYADTNANNVYDAAVDTKAAVASDGTWSMYVAPGTYNIRQSLEAGWEQTFSTSLANNLSIGPIFQSASGLRFGRRQTPVVNKVFTVSGSAFIDVNKNGKLDGTEGQQGELGGWYVYVDTNNNNALDDADLYAATTTYGAYNRYTIYLPADGKTYRLQLRNDDIGFRTFTTAGYYDLSSTTANQYIADKNFGLTPVAPGASAKGTVFNDVNKNGVKETGEAGLANVTVYVDLDNDKVLDANERWTVTDSVGAYSFSDLPNTGTATRLRAVVPAGGTQTSPTNGNGHALNLAVGATNTNKNFGVYTPPVTTTGTLSGFVFDDTNKNGTWDSGEARTSGKTVFLDLDGDNVLDTNERKTTTGTDGAWSFTGLTAGSYRVRRVFPSGYTLSTTPIDVTLTGGQTLSGLAIGSRSGTGTVDPKTASLTGYAFDDKNKNGVYDTGDVLASGKTIWLDLDDDGVKDTGEASVVSDSAGKFAFTGLAAGTYHVRRLFPSGYLESTPARYITLTVGQAGSGVYIGSKAK